MIAGIVPVCDPKLYGYGNVLAECLKSFDDFADMVVLVQSHDALDNLRPYLEPLQKTIAISDESTWYKGGIYDPKQTDQNVEIGIEYAKQRGADVIIILSSNWYIPERSRDGLYNVCRGVDDWDYIYRGDQLAGTLLSASKRIPAIIKIGSDFHFGFSTDYLENFNTRIPVRAGDYSSHNDSMIVDAPFEITLDDLAAKMNFIRCYNDVIPKRNPIFDWDFWEPYYLLKFRDKRHTNMKLDEYGKRIAANSKPEYLSHYFLRELNYAAA